MLIVINNTADHKMSTQNCSTAYASNNVMSFVFYKRVLQIRLMRNTIHLTPGESDNTNLAGTWGVLPTK